MDQVDSPQLTYREGRQGLRSMDTPTVECTRQRRRTEGGSDDAEEEVEEEEEEAEL